MSKRFTDTEIWKKKWYCDLSPAMKIFWRYICDNCDNSGVWEKNIALAEFQIGCKLSEKDILDYFKGNIVPLKENKLLVVDFISFQYGQLKKECIPHRNIFNLLEKHGLSYPIDRVYDTLKDKDKEEDKDKDKENKEGCGEIIQTWRTSLEIYLKECGEAFDRQVADLAWIEEKKRYHPFTSITKSLEKMFNEYWGTEAGWKKKKEKRSDKIDWLRTIENGLSMECNRVRIPKGTPDYEQEAIEKSKHAKPSPV